MKSEETATTAIMKTNFRYYAPPCQQDSNLNHLVYTKYRELLGSYNEKANDIIQSPPTLILQTEHDFHFNNNKTK